MFQLICTAQMGTCQETQPATIYLQRLIHCKLHGEVGNGFGILLIKFVGENFTWLNHDRLLVRGSCNLKPNKSDAIDLHWSGLISDKLIFQTIEWHTKPDDENKLIISLVR